MADETNDFYVLPLHEASHLASACADLLNAEWPRSKELRLLVLKSSSDSFPISLVMLRRDDETQTVYGHARLCMIPSRPRDCLIESVIVPRANRGLGHGKTLMLLCEQFLRGRCFKTVYLSTHDRRGFYERVGYAECPPVCTIGANAKLLEGEQFKQLRELLAKSFEEEAVKPVVKVIDECKIAEWNSRNGATNQAHIPLPPPPPPSTMATSSLPTVVYMKKSI